MTTFPRLTPALLLLIPTLAMSGEPSAPPSVAETPEAPDAIVWNAVSEFSYTSSADWKRSEFGSQDAWSGGLALTAGIPMGPSWQLDLGGGYRRFEFGDSSAPVPDVLQSASAVVGFRYLVRGKPAIIVTASPGLYGTKDLDSDAFAIPTLGIFSFRAGPSVTVSVGGLYSNLREDWPVIPIGGVIWTINDEWTLFGIMPRPRLIYSPADDIELALGGELGGGSFHTSDDDPAPDDSLDYKDFRAVASVTYRGWKPFEIDLAAGWSFQRSFEYEDFDATYRTEGAPFVRVGFSAKF